MALDFVSNVRSQKKDMDYWQGLCSSQKELYSKKLQLLQLSDDLYAIMEEKWKDDVALWPKVEFGQIYIYLIDTPGQFTREKLKAYKSLDAFNYYIRYLSLLCMRTVHVHVHYIRNDYFVFISGWVQTVYIYEHGLICLLKAKVKASQRLSDKLHEAWVAVEKSSGTIITGHCTCMAG